jgi:malate dehydrogenase
VALCSAGQYGVEKGLITSFPIRTTATGQVEVVEGVPVNEFSQGKIDATIAELKEEKALVADLLG